MNMKEEDMSENKELYLNFDEYIRQGEPAQRERAEAWRVAIGLQAVDGLKTSEYLQETARKNIEGEITIDEARERVKQYYIKKTAHGNGDEDKEEADLVSGNISKLLQTDAFTYSVAGLSAIHKAIFEGVFKHAGRFRDYDISKRSGYCEVIAYSMAVGKICVWRLSTIWNKNASLIIHH